MRTHHHLSMLLRDDKMLRAFLPLVITMSLLVAACAAATTPSPSTTPSATRLAHVTVQTYFSKHPDSDADPTAVFPVSRTIVTGNLASPSSLPTFAIQQLIAGPTDSEKQAGYYTELTGALSGPSICNNQDFTITLNTHAGHPETGTATLQFCRVTQLPGDLSGPRIKSEIGKTLMQFAYIQRVVILDKSGNCFDDLSGRNVC